MNLDWAGKIPDKASARVAIKLGAFVCGMLALVDIALASFLAKSSWRDYDSSLRWVFWELAGFYVLVAWGLSRGSRIAAVLAVCVTAWFYHDKFTNISSALFPTLVLLLLINAVRGTFVFNKEQSER